MTWEWTVAIVGVAMAWGIGCHNGPLFVAGPYRHATHMTENYNDNFDREGRDDETRSSDAL